MHKVLIIDDEPWSREVVKSLGQWSRLALRVIGEAEDGNDGLRKIEELRPDIVITDMRMPGTDGAELLEAMHSNYPQLKIIVMSGYDDFIYLKQAIRSKAVEYLLKPINPAELDAALSQSKKELHNAALQAGAQSQPLSQLFASGAAMQRYAGIRDRIYASLLELNRERAEASFDQLLRETPGGADAASAMRIAGDLMMLLERFLAEQSWTLRQLLPDTDAPAVDAEEDGEAGALQPVRKLYGKAIDALLVARQSRNRLDLGDVKSYIDARYQDAISLEAISAQFLVSKEHLSRMFKSYTGENLSDYIVRKRMEKAKALIASEGVSIKHAAQLVGYEDLAYFYRVFKKHYGITPGELRKDE